MYKNAKYCGNSENPYKSTVIIVMGIQLKNTGKGKTGASCAAGSASDGIYLVNNAGLICQVGDGLPRPLGVFSGTPCRM